MFSSILLLLAGLLFVSNPILPPRPAFLGRVGTVNEATEHSGTVIQFRRGNDTTCYKVYRDEHLFTDGWNQLPQPKFWSYVLTLDPKFSIINLQENREVLGIISSDYWNALSSSEKARFRDSVKVAFGFSPDADILVTAGKSDYYKIRETIPNISYALEYFRSEGTDPWYAQAILCIESPGLSRTSGVGARGPFQLMPSVGREMGLTVNGSVDERDDLYLSAKASARFIRTVCVPHARNILNSRGIAYNETDLWFRLLVMHCYHAGPGNVRGVLNAMNAQEGGMELIQKMWHTSHGGFGNASQNYSQIALAAFIELNRIVQKESSSYCGEESINW